MQFSFATVLSLVAVASAAVADVEGVRNVARDSVLLGRQNAGRPTPSGQCCVANTSLKQDTCTATNGQQGRCVPGGGPCGSTLSCVAQANLVCTNSIQERGKNLCRGKFLTLIPCFSPPAM